MQSSIPFGLACRANPRLTPCHSTTPFHHKYFPLAHAGSLRLMQRIWTAIVDAYLHSWSTLENPTLDSICAM